MLLPKTENVKITRQNFDQPTGWKDSRMSPPRPWLVYASARPTFTVEFVTAALPRQAPMTVMKIVGIEIPKRVRKKIL